MSFSYPKAIATQNSPTLVFTSFLMIFAVYCTGCRQPSTAEVSQTSAKHDAPAKSHGIETPATHFSVPNSARVQEETKSPGHSKILGDASQEVQRLFGNWEQPEFAFFITGRQHGYIEPCGCTGLENQKGGLLRRHTLTKALEATGWELIKIDAGNQVRRFGPQPEIKFSTTAKTLVEIFKYDSIGFGRDDLRLPAIELVSTMQNLEGLGDDPTHHPFVSNNITIFASFADESFETDKMISTYKTVQSGKQKICITSILGDEHFDAIRKDDLDLRKPDDGIEAVW
ncbi:MAG: hypothetical protein VX438_02245, partial [Planctomycetota bacterium]|nr:hypothetical protein [Planctomycetota bacterium]